MDSSQQFKGFYPIMRTEVRYKSHPHLCYLLPRFKAVCPLHKPRIPVPCLRMSAASSLFKDIPALDVVTASVVDGCPKTLSTLTEGQVCYVKMVSPIPNWGR